ncbi:hypothetical protein JXL83_02560 [candidate division WOR-3 bacterium]|nr:hypothetical protein [candidate division WOR-3 bacterium]
MNKTTRSALLAITLLIILSCGKSIKPSGKLVGRDPYGILGKNAEALGGIGRILTHRTVYTEGRISIEGTQIQGTFKSLTQLESYEKTEADFGSMKVISGCDGEVNWRIDINGNLVVEEDERTLSRIEIKKLFSSHAELDRNSDIFNIRCLGLDTAYDVPLFVIELTNSLNQDTVIRYYDTSSYLLVKETVLTPEMRTISLMSDFREVEGVTYPFKTVVLIDSLYMKQVIEIDSISVISPVELSTFKPPSDQYGD